MVFSPKKEKKFGEEGWRSKNIILPYWIFQYKDEMSDFLKVLVVMTGGLKDGDLKKCIISNNLRSILIVFNSPNILVYPLVVSSLQGKVEDKIQTTSHKGQFQLKGRRMEGSCYVVWILRCLLKLNQNSRVRMVSSVLKLWC